MQLNASHFWTHYFLGICCVTSNKPEVAVAHLTICQSQRKDLIWIYLLHGFALGQMGDYAAAEADFDRALEQQPSLATRYVLYNNRGVMRVGQKETRAKGLDDLREAVKLRPDQYQAQASLAEAYRVDGWLDEAARFLDEAIQLAERGNSNRLVTSSRRNVGAAAPQPGTRCTWHTPTNRTSPVAAALGLPYIQASGRICNV